MDNHKFVKQIIQKHLEMSKIHKDLSRLMNNYDKAERQILGVSLPQWLAPWKYDDFYKMVPQNTQWYEICVTYKPEYTAKYSRSFLNKFIYSTLTNLYKRHKFKYYLNSETSKTNTEHYHWHGFIHIEPVSQELMATRYNKTSPLDFIIRKLRKTIGNTQFYDMNKKKYLDTEKDKEITRDEFIKNRYDYIHKEPIRHLRNI